MSKMTKEEAREPLARSLYEAARKNVTGRPAWHLLDSHDAYDMGMKDIAYKCADEILVSIYDVAGLTLARKEVKSGS